MLGDFQRMFPARYDVGVYFVPGLSYEAFDIEELPFGLINFVQTLSTLQTTYRENVGRVLVKSVPPS